MKTFTKLLETIERLIDTIPREWWSEDEAQTYAVTAMYMVRDAIYNVARVCMDNIADVLTVTTPKASHVRSEIDNRCTQLIERMESIAMEKLQQLVQKLKSLAEERNNLGTKDNDRERGYEPLDHGAVEP